MDQCINIKSTSAALHWKKNAWDLSAQSISRYPNSKSRSNNGMLKYSTAPQRVCGLMTSQKMKRERQSRRWEWSSWIVQQLCQQQEKCRDCRSVNVIQDSNKYLWSDDAIICRTTRQELSWLHHRLILGNHLSDNEQRPYQTQARWRECHVVTNTKSFEVKGSSEWIM